MVQAACGHKIVQLTADDAIRELEDRRECRHMISSDWLRSQVACRAQKLSDLRQVADAQCIVEAAAC